MRGWLASATLAGIAVVGAGLSLALLDAASQPAPPLDARPAAGTTARVDRFGEPLPDQALVRLGTLGFRAPNLVGIGFRKTGDIVGFGEDLSLHVWSADGRPTATTTFLIGKKQYGWRRALSADARFAAGFLDNQTLVVWDLSGDKPADYLSRPTKDVYRLAFSANGEWLAVNDTGQDQVNDLLLCHLPTKEWSSFALGGSGFESLSFTADGKGLAVATVQDVAVIDTAEKKVRRRVVIRRERRAVRTNRLCRQLAGGTNAPSEPGRRSPAKDVQSGSTASGRRFGFLHIKISDQIGMRQLRIRSSRTKLSACSVCKPPAARYNHCAVRRRCCDCHTGMYPMLANQRQADCTRELRNQPAEPTPNLGGTYSCPRNLKPPKRA
jgi:hypothetical protein